MNIRVIIVIIIIILIFVLLTIPIVGLYTKTQKPEHVDISAGIDPTKKFCHTTPTECKSDQECADVCIDNMEYSCQETTNGKKYCLPEKTAQTKPCNINQGGVYAWTGFSNTNRLEWDCFCLYPQYFGAEGCTETPGVCDLDGVNFMNYDISSGKPPDSSNCVLPQELIDKGYTVQIRDNGTPIIVSSDMQSGFYNYF